MSLCHFYDRENMKKFSALMARILCRKLGAVCCWLLQDYDLASLLNFNQVSSA